MPRGPKPLDRKLKTNEFYCLSKRKVITVPASKIEYVEVRNSKRGMVPMLKANHNGCNLTKFISLEKAQAMRM